ncbi:MAG: SPFH/Band 7/PHB domain protein [Kiritimatiellae bacterium]|nr:SPFH/Band 7/PHB domain protein [Kiritimatiellia bacterium]
MAISGGLIFFAFVAVIVLVAIIKTAVVVPQKTAYIVERLGKYRTTLEAGFHILLPFFDRIAYRHTLKEMAIDVPPQECITKDNIAVSVDGILYLQVMDPVKASYGIGNYLFATTQLAQTTMRSEMGKLDLDRSFEERTTINGAIVSAVDKASDPWGIKVTRYEIKNITPPQSIRDAMEKQMRAEREKRAMIAESEGERQSKINRAEGERQQAIALSEGERERRINEAEGRAKEITLVADAQAEGIRKVAAALNEPGGLNSVNMQLAQQYLTQFGNLAKQNNTMIIPSDLANVAGVLKACTGIIKNA